MSRRLSPTCRDAASRSRSATPLFSSAIRFGWQANGLDIPAMARQADELSSEVFVARGGRLLGTIIVADTIRPEAKQAIEALHRMGIRG